MNELVLTYYGDDLTGSTDVMEVLEWAGVPTVLFLEPPDPETIQRRFPNARAIGVAGISRTMSPQEMDEHLPTSFAALKALGASYFHYKVCSTFDSSPTIGSIGRAAEIALEVFDVPYIPMMVGAPALRRYVAFSNLFARVDDITYRLDRHPTMSKHPITPMNESDIRLHLSQQTNRSIAAMNLLHMARSSVEIQAYFRELVDGGAELIVFDTIDEDHLYSIGHLIWSLRGQTPLVLVGSSGFQYALAHFWHSEGIIKKPPVCTAVAPVEQLIVMSGSAAPATAEQIDWAIQAGFVPIRLDSAKLIDPDYAESSRAMVTAEALAILASGQSILLFSAQGPDDPAISSTKAHVEHLGFGAANMGSLLGQQQGIILRELLEKTGLRRVVVCGGDTCGYAVRQLGIFALEALIPIAPGAPLCRASSDNPGFDRLEIALKAGQVGKPNFFESILRGSTA